MTKNNFEQLPEGPDEGQNHFYNEKTPEGRIEGLEYAIKRTKHRIENDHDRPVGVFEEHLKGLEQQLQEAEDKLGK